MILVGHEAARAALERALPSVALLLGPAGTGKATLAEHLVVHHDIHKSNVIRILKLDADSARAIVSVCDHIPQGGLRVIIIELDGSSEAAQNIILKALEETPDPLRFILLASETPLATIMSRAQVFRTGYMGEGQIATILRALGKDPALAARGGGTVAGALAAEKETDEAAQREGSVVAAAVRAAAAGEWEAMNRSMRGWHGSHSRVLISWCINVMVGRRVTLLPPDFGKVMTKDRARVVWSVLRQSPDSPIMAAAALQTAFEAR
jgi:hypothetical protein